MTCPSPQGPAKGRENSAPFFRDNPDAWRPYEAEAVRTRRGASTVPWVSCACQNTVKERDGNRCG
jgi:hypothetical protein